MRYANAGVDIEKEKEVVGLIGKLVTRTYRYRDGKIGELVGKYGHYASLIKITKDQALALHVDGVGTKVLIAQFLNKYDTIGIDCVAMNVNDLICIGATPICMLDYIAVEKLDSRVIEEIFKGLLKGAEEAGIMLAGGETATMPDVIKGFDLAGMGIGIVELNKVISGEKMKPGDVVIGLESSGIHSNGLSLARKVLPLEEYAEELLTPTKIYVSEVLETILNVDVHGLAHITGGAFTKLSRIGNYADVGFRLKLPDERPSIFDSIQSFGNVSPDEMRKTFNLGIGFCIIVDKKDKEYVMDICSSKTFEIGEIIKGKGVKFVDS